MAVLFVGAGGLLYVGEDFGDFVLQAGKFRCEHTSPGVEHDIDVTGKQCQVASNRFAHTALDAIPVDRFAEHSTCGETHPRAVALKRLGSLIRLHGPLSEEVSHGRREVLAAIFVNTLVVSVFAQPGIAEWRKVQQVISTRSPQ
jgi:hypothetical protein